MCRTNSERFRKYHGPFEIDKDIEEITKCFLTCGPHFPGVYGMMAYNTDKNARKFNRAEGFHRGGILIFPTAIQAQGRDLSFAEEYVIDYQWGHHFYGQFRYRGKLYNSTSLTMDINNWSDRKVTEIAKDIAHIKWDTDVVFKVFPSNRIFLVKRK